MDSRHRNNVVDAFRGIAILAVMAYHYTIRWPDLYGYSHAYPQFLHVGKYGVHLFFVISGLVITMTVLRSANPIEFAARRFARLYPAFLVCAVATFVLMQWGPEVFRRSWLDFLASLTMDARALGHNYVDGAYWSLAVEVKFYLFVALARWLLKDLFWLGLLVLAVASLLPLGQGWNYIAISSWWPYFLLGMAGWFFVSEKRITASACLFVASLVLYFLNRPGGLPVDMFIWGLAILMLLLLWWSPEWNPWPIRILARVGLISYSLYLIHQYLGVALLAKLTSFGLPGVAAMVLAAATMMSLAYLSFRLVEQPGNKLVMHWYRLLSTAATQQMNRARQVS